VTAYAGGIEVERVSGKSWGMDGTYRVNIPHDWRVVAVDVDATVEVHSTPPGASKIFVVSAVQTGFRRAWVVQQIEGEWLTPTPVPTWAMLSAMAVAGQLMPETVWEGLAKDAMEARDP
jgi:hypothetical protein